MLRGIRRGPTGGRLRCHSLGDRRHRRHPSAKHPDLQMPQKTVIHGAGPGGADPPGAPGRSKQPPANEESHHKTGRQDCLSSHLIYYYVMMFLLYLTLAGIRPIGIHASECRVDCAPTGSMRPATGSAGLRARQTSPDHNWFGADLAGRALGARSTARWP